MLNKGKIDKTYTEVRWVLVWVRKGLNPKCCDSSNRDFLLNKIRKLVQNPWENEDNYKKKKRNDFYHCGNKECWCNGFTIEEELKSRYKEMPPVESFYLESYTVTKSLPKISNYKDIKELLPDFIDSGEFKIGRHGIGLERIVKC